MSSRRIYPALVPNYATFTVPQHVSLASNLVAHITSDENIQEQKLANKIRDGFKRNTGLLLITASQVFFASMNVAVKKLNSLDPPVSTMQVPKCCIWIFSSLTDSFTLLQAYCCANGAYFFERASEV